MSEQYRYGLFLNLQPNDPVLTDRVEAERLAKKMSVDNQGAPVAVWDQKIRHLNYSLVTKSLSQQGNGKPPCLQFAEPLAPHSLLCVLCKSVISFTYTPE